jgi:hypothetical protein
MKMSRAEFEKWAKSRGVDFTITEKQPGPLPVQDCLPKENLEALNKTELAYYRYLQALKYPWIGVQCINLRLGTKCFYRPDFLVCGPNGRMQVHETKGFMRDDARVKIIAAATMYPVFDFFLIRKAKAKSGTDWDIEEVKPF